MTLNTTTSKLDGVFVVYLSGAILFGEESASLRNLVKDLLSKSSQIVLDLGDVTYMDSGGLRSPSVNLHIHPVKRRKSCLQLRNRRWKFKTPSK